MLAAARVENAAAASALAAAAADAGTRLQAALLESDDPSDLQEQVKLPDSLLASLNAPVSPALSAGGIAQLLVVDSTAVLHHRVGWVLMYTCCWLQAEAAGLSAALQHAASAAADALERSFSAAGATLPVLPHCATMQCLRPGGHTVVSSSSSRWHPAVQLCIFCS